MTLLTQHQTEALDRYYELQAQHPELFLARTLRPIILEREVLERYASANQKVLGVAAETPYFMFINDLVQKAHGQEPFIYSRVLNRRQLAGGTNVAVLATIANASLGNPGDIVLVEQERHATGLVERAIPRGFGELGLGGAETALQELREETGYVGDSAEFLTESFVDSGSSDARVSFYRIQVTSRTQPAPEKTEAIHGVSHIDPAELLRSIRSGEITDAFTLQAIALAGLSCK